MATEQNEHIEVIMGLIIYGGNAKSLSMEAIYAAKRGKFDLAAEKLNEANESLVLAHHSQTSLLTKDASGDNIELTLLMVHGQDHLMNAITFKDLATEVIDVYRKIDGQDVSAI